MKIPTEMLTQTNVAIAKALGVSTTAVLYARRVQSGLCARCAKPVPAGTTHCAKHRAAISKATRKRTGHKPWKPGGRGRPPVTSQISPATATRQTPATQGAA